MTKKIFLLVALFFALQIFPVLASADHIRMAVVQDKYTEASKYLVLEKFLAEKGFSIVFHPYASYPVAAEGFLSGSVDFMFSGSGIAVICMLKDYAYPILRPVMKGGWSTYSTVVIAPKGSPPFSWSDELWKDKIAAGCALATSGEFYLRAMGVAESRILTTPTHTDALERLQHGKVAFAVVKNRVWETSSYRYPNLECVARDGAEFPNATLMASQKADQAMVERLRKVLLEIGEDLSDAAVETRNTMGITGFIPTSERDLIPAMMLLEKAGVSASFPLEK